MTKTFMDDETHFRAMTLLKEHAHSAGDKLMRYEPGWDDQRIAKETGANLLSVSRLRLRVFGRIVSKADAVAADASLLEQLVAKHNALAKAIMPLDPSFLVGGDTR